MITCSRRQPIKTLEKSLVQHYDAQPKCYFDAAEKSKVGIATPVMQ